VAYDSALISIALEESLRFFGREAGRIGIIASAAGFAWRYLRSTSSSVDSKVNRARVKRLEEKLMPAPFPITEKLVSWPNMTKGRGNKKAELFVVHWTAGSLQSTLLEAANPLRSISYHYVVDRDTNDVYQLVSTDNTAHHCGVWETNQRSIGIAVVAGFPQQGGGLAPVTDAQIEKVAQLIAYNAERHDISMGLGLKVKTAWGDRHFLHPVLGHRQVKPTQCPGNMDPDVVFRLAEVFMQTVPVPNAEVPIAASVPFLTNLGPSNEHQPLVVSVQEFLVQQGHLKVSDVAGSYGYYGPKTQAAVNAFQLSQGIIPSPKFFGYWYDKTRAAANKINGN
jgi:hypothetical protein